MGEATTIKNKIFELLKEYHSIKNTPKTFVKNETSVPVSGKVFDHEEMQMITESAMDGWFTTGRFNEAFEKKLATYINTRTVLTVNSGSSANLLAITALTADELGDRKLRAGDEVITVAVSFPTTINPFITLGVVPVFVDITIPEYNINTSQIEAAITPKTKVIMVAHTLGNPFPVEEIAAICKKHNLWLIEDCCDALGATYNGKHVGTFGDLATLSFYPAHHITMGEGGAVFTSNAKLAKIVESFRDWGRDCWCQPGMDNTCGKRFDWSLGDLPTGYDHKYIYSRLGYNLKITDMQAALGLAQLNKLDSFIAQRRDNYRLLYDGLKHLTSKIILPEATINANPSWFGFLITLKDSNRNEIIKQLTEAKIATRLLFAGDIRKQPYFKTVTYRNSAETPNTETVVNNTFWIGVTPMINEEMIAHVIDTFNHIFNE